MTISLLTIGDVLNEPEEWRTSPTLPDYEVSSIGRVMRKVYESRMPNGGVRYYGGQPHYGVDSKEGRMIFTYKGKTYKVHQLVCEAFNGPRPEGCICMHVDEDYKNNLYTNLKWTTQKENLNCEKFIKYCKSRVGDNNPVVKSKKKKKN